MKDSVYRMPFHPAMYMAWYHGQKTVTRRVCRLQSWVEPPVQVEGSSEWSDGRGLTMECPYGMPGQLLIPVSDWSTIAVHDDLKPNDVPTSDNIMMPSLPEAKQRLPYGKIRPARHFPRTLYSKFPRSVVVKIEVERLSEMNDVKAIDEGMMGLSDDMIKSLFPDYWKLKNKTPAGSKPPLGPSPMERFQKLWTRMHSRYEPQLWVWVYTIGPKDWKL